MASMSAVGRPTEREAVAMENKLVMQFPRGGHSTPGHVGHTSEHWVMLDPDRPRQAMPDPDRPRRATRERVDPVGRPRGEPEQDSLVCTGRRPGRLRRLVRAVSGVLGRRAVLGARPLPSAGVGGRQGQCQSA